MAGIRSPTNHHHPTTTASPTSASSAGGQQQPPHQAHLSSLSVRQEIARFESVHPAIYAVYDLIQRSLLDSSTDSSSIAHQIRDHVLVIEGKRVPASLTVLLLLSSAS